MNRMRSAMLSAALFMLAGVAARQALADEPRISYVTDIRPILSTHCYHCHGPDAGSREADLRLDTEEGARTALEREDGVAKLLARVKSDDPDLVMPPPASKKPLKPEQIALLERWVREGSAWGRHWAFEPIVRPTVPEIREGGVLVRHPIDAFVQAGLEARELSPAGEASREALIRRVTLDLTGLPPTPADVEAFLADGSEDAYERVVDRLLAAAAYGEHMAWAWLDAARYADSNGYQGDAERTMWPWRDWVVEAFNRNVPYDQFTILQLAGDLLPGATHEQKLATGFLRNHMINGEGGRIPEENRVDYVMDMAETVGTVWLGLTMNCCRCHDHKFDPLTQQDYYSLFAFFNQTPTDGSGLSGQLAPVIEKPSADQVRALAQLERDLAAVSARIEARERALAGETEAWARKVQEAAASSPWRVAAVTNATAAKQTLELLDDGSVLATGTVPAQDTYTVELAAGPEPLAALRLDALLHESHTNAALSRSNSGNFVLTEFEVAVRRPDAVEPVSVKIAAAEATFAQNGHSIELAFDGKRDSGWAVHDGKGIDRAHSAIFRFTEPLLDLDGATLVVTMRHDSQFHGHAIGRFRLATTGSPAASLGGTSPAVLAALAVPADRRDETQRRDLAAAQRASDGPLAGLAADRKALDRSIEEAKARFPRVMVMEEMSTPRKTYMLARGLYTNRGTEVTAVVPAVLPPLAADEPRNRLGLARWLVSPDNPLTARVTVNRIWQQLFGIGLVKTTEDFGVQGETPIHQNLLDWLAADFRSNGWDMKRLMRQIVTSHTYRQSSRIDSEVARQDPENRLLARGPRFRLPFPVIRDQALAATGLLVTTIGGPPVNGYQPTGVWEGATFGGKRYTQDTGDAVHRRSLYTFWRRIIAPTMFFDSASRQTCTVKVTRTNTPLQALLTLNDVTFVEAARALAEEAMLSDEGDESGRLGFVCRRILARPPADDEREILLAGLTRMRREFAADQEAAEAFLAVGESRRDTRCDPLEHAAWTGLVLTVLNLDETLTKE
jgi:mono/diheme cytochrome c family protein